MNLGLIAQQFAFEIGNRKQRQNKTIKKKYNDIYRKYESFLLCSNQLFTKNTNTVQRRTLDQICWKDNNGETYRYSYFYSNKYIIYII